MPTTTTKSGWPYPVPGDSAAVATYFENLAKALDPLGTNYLTTGARDIANPTPAQGDRCCVAGVPYSYDGTRWNLGLTDAAQWSNLTAATNFANVVQPQAKLFNGEIHLRGIIRSSSTVTAGAYVPLTTTGNAIIAAVSAAYTNGPMAVALGMDGGTPNMPVQSIVQINARTDGGLRVAVSASGLVQYISLNGVKLPAA